MSRVVAITFAIFLYSNTNRWLRYNAYSIEERMKYNLQARLRPAKGGKRLNARGPGVLRDIVRQSRGSHGDEGVVL